MAAHEEEFDAVSDEAEVEDDVAVDVAMVALDEACVVVAAALNAIVVPSPRNAATLSAAAAIRDRAAAWRRFRLTGGRRTLRPDRVPSWSIAQPSVVWSFAVVVADTADPGGPL